MLLSRIQHRALTGKGKRRANARAWLRAFEYVVAADVLSTRDVVEAMRCEQSNNRRGQVDRAADSVNATDVRVTARPRVADSYDGRTAGNRSSQRPQSERVYLDDVERNHRPDKGSVQHFRDSFDSACYTVKVPTWALALPSEAIAAHVAAHRTVFTPPAFEDRAEGKRKAKVVTAGEAHSARLRAIAGTIRMGEQD